MPAERVPKLEEGEREVPRIKAWRKTVAKEIEQGEDPHRRNEDAGFSLELEGAFGVFDGVGGHANGYEASHRAREIVEEEIERMPSREPLDPESLKKLLVLALKKANEELAKENAEKKGTERMGTTASVAMLWEDRKTGEKKLVFAHIGDSRIYVDSGNNLRQITLDDNPAIRYVENREGKPGARALQSCMSNVDAIKTEEEQNFFDQRNRITQALGREGIEIASGIEPLEAGARILLTTDGIHDNLTDEEIGRILRTSGGDGDRAVNEMVRAAQARSRQNSPRAKKDDMSAIVIKVSEAEKQAEKAAENPEAGTPWSESRPSTAPKSPEPYEIRINADPEGKRWEPEQEKQRRMDEAAEAFRYFTVGRESEFEAERLEKINKAFAEYASDEAEKVLKRKASLHAVWLAEGLQNAKSAGDAARLYERAKIAYDEGWAEGNKKQIEALGKKLRESYAALYYFASRPLSEETLKAHPDRENDLKRRNRKILMTLAFAGAVRAEVPAVKDKAKAEAIKSFYEKAGKLTVGEVVEWFKACKAKADKAATVDDVVKIYKEFCAEVRDFMENAPEAEKRSAKAAEKPPVLLRKEDEVPPEIPRFAKDLGEYSIAWDVEKAYGTEGRKVFEAARPHIDRIVEYLRDRNLLIPLRNSEILFSDQPNEKRNNRWVFNYNSQPQEIEKMIGRYFGGEPKTKEKAKTAEPPAELLAAEPVSKTESQAGTKPEKNAGEEWVTKPEKFDAAELASFISEFKKRNPDISLVLRLNNAEEEAKGRNPYEDVRGLIEEAEGANIFEQLKGKNLNVIIGNHPEGSTSTTSGPYFYYRDDLENIQEITKKMIAAVTKEPESEKTQTPEKLSKTDKKFGELRDELMGELGKEGRTSKLSTTDGLAAWVKEKALGWSVDVLDKRDDGWEFVVIADPGGGGYLVPAIDTVLGAGFVDTYVRRKWLKIEGDYVGMAPLLPGDVKEYGKVKWNESTKKWDVVSPLVIERKPRI